MKVPAGFYHRKVTPRLLFFGCILLSLFWVHRAELGGSNPDAHRMAIITEYFGITAEEIESVITIPMEEGISGIAGIRELKGMSEFSRSRIDLKLSPGTDASELSLELREQVDRVYNHIKNLYPAVQKPHIVTSSQDQLPIFSVAFTADGRSPEEVRPFIEHQVKSSYAVIPGLGEITVTGGAPKEIHVEVDPNKAAAFGFSCPRIASTVRSANTYRVLGTLDEGSSSMPVTLEGRFFTLEDLKSFPISDNTTLGNITHVSFAHRTADSLSRIEGRQCVSLHIKSSAPNLIHISRVLREKTDYWERQGLQADIVFDMGKDLEDSFRRVALALLSGMILSGTLLVLFSREKRRILIITLGQPFLLLLSISVLSAAGKSLDSFVLAGLAVGIGMVLDAGLLITEAVGSKGLQGLQSLFPALISSTLSTLIALLPLFPLEKEIPGIASLALSLAVLLSLSLVIAAVFIPGFYRGEDPGPGNSAAGNTLLDRLKGFCLKGISRFLRTGIHIGGITIPTPFFTLVILITAGIFCLANLPKDLGLMMQTPVLFAYLEMDEGTSLEAVDEQLRSVADTISANPDVCRVQSTARRSGGELSVVFHRSMVKREDMLKYLHTVGRDMYGGFLYIPEGRGKESVSLEISLTGPDVQTLKSSAKQALGELLAEPWALEGVLHFKENPPAYFFYPDFQVLASSGFSVAQIASLLRWDLQGPVADKWQMAGREMDLRVMARDAVSLTRDDLNALTISSEKTQTYRLDQLGSFVQATESSRIHRLNRQHAVSFTVVSRRMDPCELDALVWEILRRQSLPAGYAFQPSSQLMEKKAFFFKLWTLFGLTIFLVFFLLSVERESLVKAFLIMVPLPVIMAVPLITLKVLGKELGSEALLGLILLVGLGINNGILIFDYLPKNRKPQGQDALKAVDRRFNGIFLTTATSVIGLIPLLFADDPFFINLAAVLISGLAGSFFVGLFVFPFLLTSPALLSQRPV
ncbi:MAG: efflux RND transporter permease subunit [Spirochaetales bacterium]|nr:efflux RND transporter permease subunit [Spirochaetales bacterium]